MIFKTYLSYNSLCERYISFLKPLNKRRKKFFSNVLWLFLSIKGKINFLQLERYGNSCEHLCCNKVQAKFAATVWYWVWFSWFQYRPCVRILLRAGSYWVRPIVYSQIRQKDLWDREILVRLRRCAQVGIGNQRHCCHWPWSSHRNALGSGTNLT